jgi:predicted RNA-binding protein (virulence factor B family)
MNSCSRCGEEVNSRRAEWLTDQKLTVTCMPCGEKQARQVKHCVLTLHKQGPMAFTAEFGRTAAVGANNKGGLVR